MSSSLIMQGYDIQQLLTFDAVTLFEQMASSGVSLQQTSKGKRDAGENWHMSRNSPVLRQSLVSYRMPHIGKVGRLSLILGG